MVFETRQAGAAYYHGLSSCTKNFILIKMCFGLLGVISFSMVSQIFFHSCALCFHAYILRTVSTCNSKANIHLLRSLQLPPEGYGNLHHELCTYRPKLIQIFKHVQFIICVIPIKLFSHLDFYKTLALWGLQKWPSFLLFPVPTSLLYNWLPTPPLWAQPCDCTVSGVQGKMTQTRTWRKFAQGTWRKPGRAGSAPISTVGGWHLEWMRWQAKLAAHGRHEGACPSTAQTVNNKPCDGGFKPVLGSSLCSKYRVH